MYNLDPEGRWWPGSRGGDRPDDLTVRRLLCCGLLGAACLALASFAPAPFVPFVLAELFWLAALISCVEALLRGEAAQAPHLTAWDQTALFLGATLLLSFLFGVPPSVTEVGPPA